VSSETRKERGRTREIYADGKNADGAGAAFGGVELVNERLRLHGDTFFVLDLSDLSMSASVIA